MQYIGARYVMKIYENSEDPTSNAWENTEYEPFTIVSYLNNSYISRKQVPVNVGNPTDATQYWTLFGFASGQIAYLQAQINQINAELLPLEGRAGILPHIYNPDADYTPNDYVIYNNKVYQAIANSHNILPTNTSYWTDKGDLETQIENIYTAIESKAGLDLFTPTDISITMADLSAYTSGDCRIYCKQVGRILIITFTLQITGGNTLPSGTNLNVTPIPAIIDRNTGFMVGEDEKNLIYRFLINTDGYIRPLANIPSGSLLEGQLILPASGYI